MNDAAILKQLRKDMIRTARIGRDANLQSCFSSLEILWTLYDKILKFNDPRDRFVLSKGQANLALMTVLAQKGFIPREELNGFCALNSRISMQADRTKFGGIVECSAGSLGHGFPMAAGMTWAAKIRGTSERVYALAGDGEMNEGTMWEAAMFAASQKLDDLTLIIDDNRSARRMIDMGDLSEKLAVFGFDVITVDGHNIAELSSALSKHTDKPMAVIAKTVRGYGSRTLAGNNSWFHRYPNEEEEKLLCGEVDEF